MRFSISISAALLGLVGLVAASNVIDLDVANFDKYVGGSKGALVELWVILCASSWIDMLMVTATLHGADIARTVCPPFCWKV
jgi:hypothetical protein